MARQRTRRANDQEITREDREEREEWRQSNEDWAVGSIVQTALRQRERTESVTRYEERRLINPRGQGLGVMVDGEFVSLPKLIGKYGGGDIRVKPPGGQPGQRD